MGSNRVAVRTASLAVRTARFAVRTAAGPQPDRKSNFTPLSRRVLLPVEVYLPDSGFDGPADSFDL